MSEPCPSRSSDPARSAHTLLGADGLDDQDDPDDPDDPNGWTGSVS